MKQCSFPVGILAGGLATRLRPLTTAIPKALIEINGEPFIAHQLRLLQKNHIQQVVICIGYLGERIVDFVGNGANFGLDVTYSFDGSQLLGTAGAIKKALPLLGSTFFVLYGDSYLLCDYTAIQQFFCKNDKLALMTVFKNDDQGDKSNVEFSHNRILVYDKQMPSERMQHIDYGLGVFTDRAFAMVPVDESYDLALLYQQLLMQQQLMAYEVKEKFYEVGSFAGIGELGYYLQRSSCQN